MVISGPSGVGKSTIVREVLKRTRAEFSVSVTTRRPRPGEVDGHDYRFVDRPAFDEMVRRGELLEWAEVFGNRYGTPAEPVARAIRDGRTIVLDIDVQGAQQVHGKMPEATFVLVAQPDDEALRQRLKSRGSENEQEAARRFAKAAEELKKARDSGIYGRCVVNDELETAVETVVRIVNEESTRR